MPVLKQISGIAKPFEVVGILGPSGCGKTSLLNVLSAREQPGKYGNLGGYTYLNGVEMTREYFSKVGAFVQQDDVLLSTMTPYECFKFGAALKLTDMNQADQEARVNKLIKDLRLTKCRNTKVGNVILRGLSGGQRKRTSIGYELITNPSLLLLDEPTSGIDSFTALEIMNLLHRQSRQGRTVVASIHQPSSDIFLSLDRVILMNRGHIIYQGSPIRVLSYFKSVGFKCSKFINPADFILKVALRPELALPTSSKCLERDYLVNKYTEILHNDVIEQIARSSELTQRSFDFDMIQTLTEAPVTTQLYQLLARHYKFVMRNPIIFRIKIFQAIFTLFFAASLWWRTAEQHSEIGYKESYNLLGLSFFLSSNLMFPTALGIILNFPQLETLYLREQLKSLYRPSSFFWSIILVELVFFQVYPLIITLTYFFIDAGPTVTAYFTLLAASVVMTALGLAMGYSMSIIFQGEDTARVLMVFLLLLMMLGSGLLVNLSSLRSWLSWLEYISVLRYNIEIFLRAFVSSFDRVAQHSILNGFHYSLGYGVCFAINLCILGFFLLLGWVALILRPK